MRVRSVLFVLLLVLTVLPGAASAQTAATAAAPWSVSAIGGFGRTWDDESQIGLGLLVGGRIDAALTRRLRVEGTVDWLRHDRDEGVFRSEGRTTLLGGALRFQFGGEETYGYVLGGPLVAFHSGRTTFESVGRDVSSTDGGLSFGGGFAAPIGRRAELGPEARLVMLWADDGSAPAYAIYGGIRIAFR